jgi:hypothetical protein
MKEIKLTDNQLNILVENQKQIQFLNQEIEKLALKQRDIITFCFENEKIDFNKLELNIDKKVLILH